MRNTSLPLSISFIFLLSVCVFAQGAGKTYSDKKNGFSFSYPADFKISVGTKAESLHYFGDPGKGKKLVKVYPRYIPEKYHGSYEFNIWLSDDPKDKCGAPEADEFSGADTDRKRPKTRTIAGHTFFAYNDSDAGMSKSMGMDGLRGIVNNKCWQIQAVTEQVYAFDHTTNFNHKIIDKAFERFVNSFRFVGAK